MSIKEKLSFIKSEIKESAIKAGRTPEEIKLIAVSKKKPVELISEALSANQIAFGENYIQEALGKIKMIKNNQKIEWHMIGSLQKNKVKFCPGNFEWIHTVDSIALLQKVETCCSLNSKKINALVQVNLSKEYSKNGLQEWDDILRIAEKMLLCKWIKFRGLMTIPPANLGELKTRKIFEKIRGFKDKLQLEFGNLEINELSMGMSADFNWAIKEGATMIRVGTAIFGEREVS